MNVLIVYAHPDPRSFSGAMKDLALDVLKKQGHALQISDLYAMNFFPVVSRNDFTDPLSSPNFNLQAEQKHAARRGTLATEIIAEQKKLQWSDMILFHFPLWWYSVPAILKGWIDRVFTYGFAYGDNHNLRGRRAMLTLTTGGAPRPFTPEKQQVINEMLNHIQRGTLHFCGIQVLPPFAVYGGDQATREQREQFLLQYRQILLSLDQLLPLDFSQ